MLESYLGKKKKSWIEDLEVLGVGHTAIVKMPCYAGIIEKVAELKKVRKMAMWISRRKEFSQCMTPQRQCLVLKE